MMTTAAYTRASTPSIARPSVLTTKNAATTMGTYSPTRRHRLFLRPIGPPLLHKELSAQRPSGTRRGRGYQGFRGPVLTGLSQHGPAHGGHVDVEQPRGLAAAQAPGEDLRQERVEVPVQDLRPADVASLGLGAAQAREHPLTQDAALERGVSGRDVVERLPEWGRGVEPALLQAPEPDPPGAEAFQGARGLGDGAERA